MIQHYFPLIAAPYARYSELTITMGVDGRSFYYTPELGVASQVHVQEQVWLNDSRDSVYVHCIIIANWHDLSYKAEPLENNWALAPMDQWRRYGNASNCQC